jgi:acyl-CoA thioester hydrolase
MTEYTLPVDVRWADLDANNHVRHSVYYDWGAQARMNFLTSKGLGANVLQEQHFGPILFREECIFRREIRFGDEITINIQVLKLRRDLSRFSIKHEIKRKDGTLCAVLTIDGAWIDTNARKLTVPPQIAVDTFGQMPMAEGFEWID